MTFSDLEDRDAMGLSFLADLCTMFVAFDKTDKIRYINCRGDGHVYSPHLKGRAPALHFFGTHRNAKAGNGSFRLRMNVWMCR